MGVVPGAVSWGAGLRPAKDPGVVILERVNEVSHPRQCVTPEGNWRRSKQMSSSVKRRE